MHQNTIGVIDIGSNSMRLVVYDGIKRAPLPLFNEKVLCGLGRGLGITGKLNPAGVKLAEESLTRFLALARAMQVVELDILATAAIRDAADGAAWVEKLERRHGIHIEVISGKREAKLAAYGIFSSIHEPRGLAGDLGGGSMELVHLTNEGIAHQMTMPIGPLRLLDASGGSTGKMRKMVDKVFDALPWTHRGRVPHFYAIGGSFRALAKIYMEEVGYPLHILHHYTVPADEITDLTRRISKMTADDIAALPGASGKRAPALIPASLVLQSIVEISQCKEVVFSTFGIREGFLYEKLSPHARVEDPLIASVTDLATQYGRSTGYAQELFVWMSPIFPKEPEGEKRLRLAACLMSEIAWGIHAEYRAEWSFWRIMQSSLMGLSHPQRVALAAALYHRHQFKLKGNWAVLRLMSERARLWVRVVGAAAGLAYNISGGVPGTLPKTRLEVIRGDVAITLSARVQNVAGEVLQRRIDTLGEALRAFTGKK